jgi:hypothetical protein
MVTMGYFKNIDIELQNEEKELYYIETYLNNAYD